MAESSEKIRLARMKAARRAIIQTCQRLEDSAALGRIARKNARASAFGAIRALENAINELYPTIAKEVPPSQKTLLHFSENLDWKAFRREVIALAPETWDQTEVQAFANWILERHGEHPRPIARVEFRDGHSSSFDNLVIGIDRAEVTVMAHVVLWQILAEVVRPSISKKDTERSRVRALYQVVQAWFASEWREPLQETEHGH